MPPLGIPAPPLDPPCDLQAPATIAVNATNMTGFSQLGIGVDDRLDFIVVTLCMAQTVRGLEHQKHGGVPSESLPMLTLSAALQSV